MPPILFIFVFTFGLIVGSFANVLIYRLPLGISLFLPRSFCPGCNKTVVWYENIPLLSFLFLRGKCSKCSVKIPFQYPLVELSIGIIALLLFPSQLDPQNLIQFIINFSVAVVFLSMFIIDLRFKIIPNQLNAYLGILFLAYAIIFLPLNKWLVGGLIGFGFPALITWIFYLLRGEIGLGGGDIKLFGVLGIYLGPMGIIHNIFLSCFLGSIVGGSLILTKKLDRKNPIPFGPFIIAVASFQILFPNDFARLISLLN
jgi:leader peptidase (prepilin peptidase)/N-methyltransferase